MDNRFINIPYHILFRKDISDKGKILYGLVNGFFDGEFKASNKYVAQLLNTTPRNVQKTVKQLVEKRLIRRTVVVEDGITKGRVLIVNKGTKV